MRAARRFVCLAVLGGAAAGCGDDLGDTCDDGAGTARAALTAQDRKLIGAASAYPADGLLRGREDELWRSQASRRAAAWAAVERTVASVPFAIDPGAAAPAALPRWHTWYGSDDLRRLFERLFRGLSPDEMRARAAFSDPMLDEAFAWNPTAVEELASWPEQRWLDYVAAIDDAAEVAGIGGIDRVQYSPGAARHLLRSYAPIVGCEGQPVPPEVVDAPTPGPRRMLRETLALAACDEQHFGPYFVGDGETLEATVEGGGPGAEVRLRAGAAPSSDAHDCAGVSCTASGPAAVYVSVRAAAAASTSTILTIDYQETDAPWTSCLASPFPLDAAFIKADWRRAELGVTVPVFDTSASGLGAAFAGAQEWTASAEADPEPATIYTLALPAGPRYRLAGLHLMTKELDHWLWVTLWWSPSPDTDFGADRPASLAGVWRNYKMCVVTAFREGDPDPTGGFTGSLAAALATAHPGAGGPTWCSNPMIELGHGNASSTCIGCHQHGGAPLVSETILADDVRFPDNGRRQTRNNFPDDYTWAVTSGDRLGRMFADQVEYWTPPPL
jgi:hypothetical protein